MLCEGLHTCVSTPPKKVPLVFDVSHCVMIILLATITITITTTTTITVDKLHSKEQQYSTVQPNIILIIILITTAYVRSTTALCTVQSQVHVSPVNVSPNPTAENTITTTQ